MRRARCRVGSVAEVGAETCAQRGIREAPVTTVDAGERASAFKFDSGIADDASPGSRPGRDPQLSRGRRGNRRQTRTRGNRPKQQVGVVETLRAPRTGGFLAASSSWLGWPALVVPSRGDDAGLVGEDYGLYAVSQVEL